MKLIHLSILSFSLVCSLIVSQAKAELTWLSEEAISADSVDSYLASAGFATNHTGIVADRHGIPHVAWFSGSPSQVYYANRLHNAWQTPVTVTSATAQARNPSLAIDSSERLHIAWHDYRNGGINNLEIYYNTATIGGNWDKEIRLTNTVDVNNTNGDNGYCPALLAEPSGQLHLCWYDFHWNGWKPDLAYKSAAQWNAWDTTESIDNNRITNNSLYETPNPAMALGDDGTAYLVWNDDNSGYLEIYFMKKAAGSSTWSSPVQLSFDSTTCKFPAVTVDHSGNVFVFWSLKASGTQAVRMKKYDASRGTWDSATTVTTTAPSSNTPSATVDTYNRVHLVWNDNRDGTQKVYYRSLSAAGQWSDEIKLSMGSGSAQYPEIISDVDGNIHCIWQDNRSGYSRIYYREAQNSTGVSNWLNYPWE
jgi:hypothetical protein